MKNKILYFSLIFIFTIILFGGTSYAGSQKLNDLHYEAVINEDGSADITEIWEIKVSDTNTLFRNFSKTTTGITNVTVSEIDEDGTEKPFSNSYKYQYHVDKGYYYALPQSGKFEIAWGVSISETETKKYKISYNVIDAVKTYQDCSEFNWQIMDTTNGIPAKKVTGIVKLPKPVENRKNLRVWAHGPYNGNIEIIDNQTVSFEVKNLSTNTMLEIRVVTIENIFNQNTYKTGTNGLNKILAEEQGWANEANAKRRTARITFGIVLMIGIVIALFIIVKIVKYAKILAKVKKIEPEQKLDYFRDFPSENATPAEAAFLYYFDKSGRFKVNISKIVSAIILDLALKGAVAFEKGKKDDIYIIIKENYEVENLKEDEKSIFDLLLAVKAYLMRKKNKETIEKISMEDIEKYAKTHDKAFLDKVNGIEKKAEKEQEENGNFDKKIIEESDKWSRKAGVYVSIAIVGILASYVIAPVIIAIPSIICCVICHKIAKKKRNLTQKGENEREQWKALKKYMEDFSLLNEREVPELVLWEKYLVYATAFGIADKVLSQLKVRYPEFTDESFMINNGYTYMYMLNRINMDRMIVSGMTKAYNAGQMEMYGGNYSSGRRSEAEVSQADGGGRIWSEAGMGGR